MASEKSSAQAWSPGPGLRQIVTGICCLLAQGAAEGQAAPPRAQTVQQRAARDLPAGERAVAESPALDELIEGPAMPAAPGPYPEDPAERMRVQADTLARVGKCPQAWGLYQRAAQLDPYNLRAHDGLAYCAFRTGEFATGAARLRVALRDNPGYQRGWLHLGRLERAAGQKVRAVGSIRKYLQLRPDDPAGRLEEARALQGIGRQEEAAAAFADYQQQLAAQQREVRVQQQQQGGLSSRGAAQASAAEPPASRLHQDILLRSMGAKAASSPAAAPVAPRPAAAARRAAALPAPLQLPAAELALAIARDLPGQSTPGPETAQSPGQELIALAERHFVHGQPLIALGLFQQAAAQRQLAATALYRAALVALSQKQLLRAKVLFGRLQALSPQSALLESGQALLAAAVQEQRPPDTAVAHARATALLGQRRYREALRLLDGAVLQEAAPQLLLLRAQAQIGRRQLQAALLDLARAALLDPELSGALVELAEVQLQRGDHERAVFYYRVALGREGPAALGSAEATRVRRALRRLTGGGR